MTSIGLLDSRYTNRSPRAVAVALRKTTRPQPIYVSSGKLTFPIVLFSCALVNLVFWGNLSQWVYADYTVKNESTGSFEKASTTRRLAYSSSLAGLGIGISTAFLLVSKRIAKRVDILPGGNTVALYTGFFRRTTSTKFTEIPVRDLSLKRSMFTGQGPSGASSSTGTYTQLLRKGQMIGYLVDREGIFLASPRVMDELFYVDRK